MTASIEFLFVADRAESIGGKLYVMGGAWDRMHVSSLPHTTNIGIALRVAFEPGDVAVEHVVEFGVIGPGEPKLGLAGLRFAKSGASADGRPAHGVVGAPTAVTFTEEGLHKVWAKVDDGPRSEAEFEVAVSSA